MALQPRSQELIVSGNIKPYGTFKCHPRECGDPASVHKYETLSNMDSHLRRNDVSTKQ